MSASGKICAIARGLLAVGHINEQGLWAYRICGVRQIDRWDLVIMLFCRPVLAIYKASRGRLFWHVRRHYERTLMALKFGMCRKIMFLDPLDPIELTSSATIQITTPLASFFELLFQLADGARDATTLGAVWHIHVMPQHGRGLVIGANLFATRRGQITVRDQQVHQLLHSYRQIRNLRTRLPQKCQMRKLRTR